MIHWSKFLNLFVALILLFGMVGAGLTPGTNQLDNVQPALVQLAAEAPEQEVRVIVQQAADAGDGRQLIEALGGTYIRELSLIDAFVAKLQAENVGQLAQSGGVSRISLDAPVVSTGKPPTEDPCANDACPPNTYLDTLGVPQVWDMGYRGEGIGVAVIDSGIFGDRDFTVTPDRPHMRLVKNVSFNSNTVADLNGHGTHVAGILGGNGAASAGVYSGIAPKVDLINLRISDDFGMAYESDTVEAMQWVLVNKDRYNIRVVNLSVNSTVETSYYESPVDAAAEVLWFNGLVVVVAAGNQGPEVGYNTVKAAPANDPFIITVGATLEHGTPNRSDDTIASFSGYGTTSDGHVKPEIVAPGKDIISVLSSGSDWYYDYPERAVLDKEYFRISGTSMSAPMVAGAAALLLQAEPDLTPDQVKYRLIHTAGDIAGNSYLDVYAALTTPTTESANQGVVPHMLLAKMALIAYWASENGEENIDWENVDWSTVNWNAVNWNAVNWNAVNWNAVNWNAVNWNAVNWNAVNWNAVNWNAVNWNAVNWNAVNWNAVNWNAVNWNAVSWDD